MEDVRSWAQSFAAAENRYISETPASRAMHARALQVLPDGIGRAGLQYHLHPLFIERAEGQYLFDADGRRILDLWYGASSLPVGHSHPVVIKAMQDQLSRGLGFGMMSHHEVDLAHIICSRMRSIERIRFTASGTEATMYAIRLARAFTGRTLIARMGGSYHGLHDLMCTGAGMSLGGTQSDLEGDPVSLGVLPTMRDGVLFLPFNDLAACTRIVEQHAQELAGLIVEPFIGTGGGVVAEPDFIRGLRALCDRHDILLIFDEMISIGMARGGAQEYFGVDADLTTAGKLIGAGMPVGAFGGRADVMAMLEAHDGVPPVLHTGTWNGHPLVMAAGVAQYALLDDEAYRYLHYIGDLMRRRVRALAVRMGVTLQVVGACQFSAFHYTDRPIRRPEDTHYADAGLARRVAFSLLSQGIFMFSGRSNLSTAVTENDIDTFIGALELAFVEAGAARPPAMCEQPAQSG